MILSWSVLVLALIGAEDQQPSQPRSPGSPVAIEIDGGGCKAIDSASCRRAATAIAAKPVGQKPKPGTLAKVANLCAKLYLAYLLDEVKAACAEIGEVPTPVAATHPTALPKPLSTATALPKLDDPEAEMWPMPISEAIRIALENNEVVRVISAGRLGNPLPVADCFAPRPPGPESNSGPMVIARVNADTSLWRFKAEIMAEVRSVEQTYWNLVQAHVQLWAADRSVDQAQEILEREQAELQGGRGTVADIAEVAQRLEQFRLDLVTRTSDVITAEQQLRNLLGLPPFDNRRIIPVTPPIEESVEFDWDACLHEMMDGQPDVAQQKAVVKMRELQLLLARDSLRGLTSGPPMSLEAVDQLDILAQHLGSSYAAMAGPVLKALESFAGTTDNAPGSNEGLDKSSVPNQQVSFMFQMPRGTRAPLANARQAQYALLRDRAYLHQVVHQTTHTLARFFLEIDSDYKQFKTASRLRAAAAQRLDAQRVYYEEGRITIDRFLEATSQYFVAVAAEAQYRTTYNIALAALAEAKGSLLADQGIVLAEGPRPGKTYLKARQVRGPSHVQAAAPGQGVKPAPPRWAEVTQITRHMAKRDRQTVPAALGPEPTHGLEVPRVTPLTEVSPVPRMVPVPESAAAIWPRTPSHATETAATDVAGKANEPANAKAKARTWTFDISIGGADPIRIKGTIRAMEDEAPRHSDEP